MATYLTRPYWWDAAEPHLSVAASSPDNLPKHVETLIVGAGYSGLSAALTLARAGREVLVVDAEMPAYGCSSRNGGLIGPSFHKLGLSGLKSAFGQEKATAILRESMDCLNYLKNFLVEEKIDCGLHLTGRFRGVVKPAGYESVARESEDLASATGMQFEMIPRAAQHAEIGSDHYHGGVVYLDDGHLHPGLYARALVERVLVAGAQIIAPARVTGVTRNGAKLTVRIGEKEVSAGQVLVATNGYSGPEMPFFHHRVIPIRSAIIATEQLPAGLMSELSPKNRGFGESSRLVLYYRPSPDGTRMIFGGRAFDLADRPDRYVPDLRRMMHRIFPQLSDTQITHAWSGTVAYTFDHAPHLGVHDGVHYVMGYCGSGVGRASYFGRKVALQMLGDPEGRTELDDLSFESKPFYNGTPWFLPAFLRWNSMMDRFGL